MHRARRKARRAAAAWVHGSARGRCWRVAACRPKAARGIAPHGRPGPPCAATGARALRRPGAAALTGCGRARRSPAAAARCRVCCARAAATAPEKPCPISSAARSRRDRRSRIRPRDVWLAYGRGLRGPFAVEAIDLQVPRGAFSAIVAPSGCGKSAFMKLATGLQLPSRGRILIDGRAVTGPLKISGMAFQAPSLLPWRNILDNVLLPLEIVEPYRS